MRQKTEYSRNGPGGIKPNWLGYRAGKYVDAHFGVTWKNGEEGVKSFRHHKDETMVEMGSLYAVDFILSNRSSGVKATSKWVECFSRFPSWKPN